jgi:hypothetical protein
VTLDRNFLPVTADVRVGDVLELVRALAPSRVVVLETPGFGELDDDEDDVWFVLDCARLAELAGDLDLPIGRFVAEQELTPVETVERWLSGGEEPVVSAPADPDAPTLFFEHGAVAGVGATDDLEVFGGTVDTGPPATDPGAVAGVGVRVEHPPRAVVGQTFSLVISITGDLTGRDVVPVAAAVGDQLDVVVSPRSGVVADGPAEGRLTVGQAEAGEAIQVRLRATVPGPALVTVYVFRDRRELGSLTLTPEVVAEAEAGTTATVATGPLGPGTAPGADLELLVFEGRDDQERPQLLYRLSARDPGLGLNLAPYGPVSLDAEPSGILGNFYNEIEGLPVGTPEERAVAAERLRAIGAALFEQLFPADLRVLLWDLQDRITSVQIQSEEPWVPWEICRLTGVRDGRVVEGEFLCERFELTRWRPGQALRPRLSLTNLGLIVPPDSGLTSAEAEAAALRALARDGRVVVDVPADYVAVRRALSAGGHDGIHFCGHGAFPDRANPERAEIELARPAKLRPSDLSGAAANLGLTTPLVFLNACQTGRQAPALTGVGGWANALMKAGAGAFVGTHWEVDDDLALTFARTFYARLDEGATVAAAAHAARLAIRDGGDPTWLAYTVFAGAGARLGG